MSTLTQYLNSQFTMIQELDFFARILTACLCGACIGFERSRRLKEAGIRTHIIVCCAAALLMIISKYGFADPTDAAGTVFHGTRGADPARIAAQVVSGISFLGAGVIFKHGSTVKGLTTAAGIWATAGIGLAIGSGMFILGLFTTAVIAIFQILMHRFRVGADAMVTNRLRVAVQGPADVVSRVTAHLEENRVHILESRIDRKEDGSLGCEFLLRSRQDLTAKELAFLLTFSEVSSISCEPAS